MCFPEGLTRTLAEYLCLPSLDTAEDFLGLIRLTSQQDINYEDPIERGESEDKPWELLTAAYRWSLSVPPTLPPKPAFTRWLTTMFFKLAFPVSRQIHDAAYRINQPLTLLTFFRLCSFLVETRGIPPHWIATLIDSLLTGSITTAAKPPTNAPIRMLEVQYVTNFAKAENKTYNISILLPEIRALLIRYRPILPFRITTPLPPREEVATFAMKMNVADRTVGPINSLLALAFTAPGVSPQQLWRQFIGGNAVEMKGYIVGSFEWVLDEGVTLMGMSGTARWCMETKVVEEMKGPGWNAWVLRTDKWTGVSRGESLSHVVEVGIGSG